jgi:hypothetical protein
MDINFKMGHYFIKEAESERKNLEEFFLQTWTAKQQMIKVNNEEMLTDAKESVNLKVPSPFLPVFAYIYNLNTEEDLTSTSRKTTDTRS